jgi:hypothetical protein
MGPNLDTRACGAGLRPVGPHSSWPDRHLAAGSYISLSCWPACDCQGCVTVLDAAKVPQKTCHWDYPRILRCLAKGLRRHTECCETRAACERPASEQ